MYERVVALATLIGALLFLTQAWALPFGSAARPGAGFFPFFVAVFGGVVGLAGTVRAFRRTPAGAARPAEALGSEPRGRVVVAVVLLVVFCALVPWAGYPLAAVGFVTVLLRRLGASWRAAVLTGVASAALSHYLFAVLLDVPLPRGPW